MRFTKQYISRTHSVRGLILFVFFCLLQSIPAAGQSPAPSNPVSDSLLTVLKQLQSSSPGARRDTSMMNVLLALVENSEDDNVWPAYNKQAGQLAESLLQNDNSILKRKGKKGLADVINNTGVLYLYHSEATKALKAFEQSMKLREEAGDQKGIAGTLNNMGLIYKNSGDIIKAMDCYTKSMEIQQSLLDKASSPEEINSIKKDLGYSINNIGAIYNNQGDIPKALSYFDKSLKIMEELGDKKAMAHALSNIGTILKSQNDLDKAFDYFIRSLKVHELIGDRLGMATTLNNLGGLSGSKNNKAAALSYYTQSLKLMQEIGNKSGIANSLNNIGSIYCGKERYSESLDNFRASLAIRKSIGDKDGIADSFRSIANIYFVLAAADKSSAVRKNDLALGLRYADSSLILSKELGYAENIRNAEYTLWNIDSARGNFEGALDHYRQYILFRDSISNESNRKLAIKSQMKYEFDKKESILQEQQDKERIVAYEKQRFQKIVIGVIVAGFILLIVFSVYIFRSLKTTLKQKLIIEQKQEEILDSIRYAKRIQSALMTPETTIEKSLNRLQK